MIPKNWYVKVTNENRGAINSWKIEQQYCDDLFENLCYRCVLYDGSGWGDIEDVKNENVIECITFKDFQKYVLKIPEDNYNDNNNEYNKALIKLFKKLKIN